MSNNYSSYHETHSLQLNVYLFFYVYVFAILIIANVLPAWQINYFVLLFLGIAGIGILVIKLTYSISIEENQIKLSINIPLKIILLKLKIEDIENAEKAKITPLTYPQKRIEKNQILYFFKKEDAIKLTTLNGKVFIISGIDSGRIITRIKSYKEKYR
ncbi:MAG: hypothetical protein ABIO55_08595 [Ginsengibacter sp.]